MLVRIGLASSHCFYMLSFKTFFSSPLFLPSVPVSNRELFLIDIQSQKTELVTALTSNKLLKLKKPNWNMHPPQEINNAYLQVQSRNNPKFFETNNSSAVVSSASRWPDYF
jgi:hypothetical protein